MKIWMMTLALTTMLAAATHAEMPKLDDAGLDALIDKHRKADFTLTLTDAAGKPIVGEASWQLDRHAFEFGTAISARVIGAPRGEQTEPSEENQKKYAEIVEKYFTAVVVENAMKHSRMEDKDGPTKEGDRIALHAAKWARDRGLYVRGHCVFWGVKKRNPEWAHDLADSGDKAKIEARLKHRLKHVTTLLKDHVTEWDLNNEIMHQDFWGQALGLKNGATYFKWAKEIAPEMTFYVNDYNVLQHNRVDRYVKHIREMIDAGAKIGGIGDQAHFAKPIPANEKVWEILDKLGQFGVPVKITEFDLVTRKLNEEQRAEHIRRFYRVCFAHPAVEGIYMWGFWDGQHWRKGAGLWARDWTPKPAAKAYMKLITEEWTTKGSAAAADGKVTFRGFPGRYTVTVGGVSKTVELRKAENAVAITVE